jgi:hypothetical protein
MKTLLLFYKLNHYIISSKVFFFKKILSIIFSLIFLLEYIILFILSSKYMYIFNLYKYSFKNNSITYKQKVIYNSHFYKKKKIKKELYKDKILKLYYNRWIYYGLSIVYLQIFLRKMREQKNYIIYVYNYKLKKSFNNLKKKIIYYSLLLYFLNNYNIVLYYSNLKKKLFNFIVILSFIEILKKAMLYKNIYSFSSNKLLLKIWKKWK